MKIRKKGTPRIFVHMQGGLGNQLFIYFGTKYLEEHLNKRIILISKTKNKLSRVGIKISETEIILPQIVYQFIITVLAKMSRIKVINPFIYFNKDVGHETFFHDSNKIRFISGYFQSFYYFENCSLIKHSKNKFILESTSRMLFDKEIDFQNSIAIHIRRGDYLLNKNGYFGLLSADYYRTALSKVSKFERYDSIYLFSDSKISNNFKDELKIKSNTSVVDMTEISDLDDVATLALLTKFRINIISNSTFSWWGAFLGESDKTVIAPSKWFRLKQDPKQLYPRNWLTNESHWE
jgi:hypothetical protein